MSVLVLLFLESCWEPESFLSILPQLLLPLESLSKFLFSLEECPNLEGILGHLVKGPLGG